mgnify:CR=1 FL=1
MINISQHELSKERLEKFIKETQHKYKTAQKKLCFAKIRRIYIRVRNGYIFEGVKICHEKGMVVEGNHRFIAYSLAGEDFEIIAGTSNRSDEVSSYNEISIDNDNDWDIHDSATNHYCDDNYICKNWIKK